METISPNMPKDLRVLLKLSNLLEATSGYEPLKVWRGRSVLSAKDTENCLSILEAPRPGYADGVGLGAGPMIDKGPWTLLLQGWPADDKERAGDVAYEMKWACINQLSKIMAEDERTGLPVYPEHYRLGDDINSLTIGRGVVRPASEEAASRLAMFYVPLVIEITIDVRNPSK